MIELEELKKTSVDNEDNLSNVLKPIENGKEEGKMLKRTG